MLLLALLSAAKAEPDVTELLRAQASRITSLEAEVAKLTARAPKPGKGAELAKLADAVGETEAALHAFRLAERRRDSQRKLEQLAPLFSATLPAPVQALAVSTLITEKNAPRLVIAADARGSLHLLAAKTGEVVLSAQTAHAAGARVTAVTVGTREDPFVATAATDGKVLVYNLTLPRAAPATPKKGAGGASTAAAGRNWSLALAATIALPADPSAPPTKKGAAPAPPVAHALDVYLRGRKPMLVAGDERGAVHMVWRNGTARGAAIAAGGAASAVAAIARQNTMLAAAARASDINGDESDGVAIIDLAKRSVTTRCVAPAGAGAVVRVAWDAQLPQLLYAGTASGRLLVYNSRARTKVDAPKDDNTPTSRGSAKTVQTCKLVHSIEGHAALPLSLAVVKGYVLSATAELLAAHNVSGLYGRQKGDPNAVYGLSLADGSALLAGTGAGHVALATGAEVTLFESKLVYSTGDGGDGGFGGGSGFMRNPLFLGVILVTVGWQVSKFMGNKRGGDDDFGGGMGGMPGMGGGMPGMPGGMGGMPGGMGGFGGMGGGMGDLRRRAAGGGGSGIEEIG